MDYSPGILKITPDHTRSPAKLLTRRRWQADINRMNTEQESSVAENGTVQLPVKAAQAQQGGDANTEIVPANLRALEAIYFAAMLEEARVFDVVERLVTMFSQGS